MAEFEEKLNQILGNQEAMGQIMALARSLSGDGGEPSAEQQEAPAQDPPPVDLSALLGQLDPSMLQTILRVVRESQGDSDRNAALLAALRPFLKEERRARLDQALMLARVTRMIRLALGAMGGRGEEGV